MVDVLAYVIKVVVLTTGPDTLLGVHNTGI